MVLGLIVFYTVRLAKARNIAVAQAAREGLAKFLAPLTNRFMGDNNATFSEKQFNVPRAAAEHVIQPDSVADDLSGKAMTIVKVG